MDPDGHLSEAEEQELWRHYGLDYGARQAGPPARPQPAAEALDRPSASTRAAARLATTRPAGAPMRR
jgi:hypothetical protein